MFIRILETLDRLLPLLLTQVHSSSSDCRQTPTFVQVFRCPAVIISDLEIAIASRSFASLFVNSSLPPKGGL